MKMLSRFSLYGFLKNMQFFEPFLILYFLDLGLSFFQIGLLVSFRSICINFLEIPSGAFADINGKKNAMLISLSSYILSFIIFFIASSFITLVFAMFFFSIGETFRTGTHKAIIFDWLSKNNILNEKTRVYGYTRSWSKIGNAFSVIISTIIVITLKEYRWIFIFTIIPYTIGIWNILNYPAYLNHKDEQKNKKIHIHLLSSVGTAFKNYNIRKLIIQSAGYEGVFKVSKDYLQPIIKAQAIIIGSYFLLSEQQSTAIIIGIVYFILYILSATAARKSHKFANYTGSEQKASLILILSTGTILLISAIGLYFKLYILPITAFIIIFIQQNIWRPILISQFDNFSNKNNQATILSIESQSKSVGVFLLAPIAGFIADSAGIHLSLALMSFILFILGIWSFSNYSKTIR